MPVPPTISYTPPGLERKEVFQVFAELATGRRVDVGLVAEGRGKGRERIESCIFFVASRVQHVGWCVGCTTWGDRASPKRPFILVIVLGLKVDPNVGLVAEGRGVGRERLEAVLEDITFSSNPGQKVGH